MAIKRSSGILLPISALPSPWGIGTLGRAAYEFIDFLAEAGQSWWQILPAGPTSYGDSPYQSFSTFAGNPYFVDLEQLREEGLLTQEELEEQFWGADPRYVDYGAIYQARFAVLEKAARRGLVRDQAAFEVFVESCRDWLPDYALFMALKRHYGMKSWTEWPDEDVRLHRPEAVEACRQQLRADVELFEYIQFLFFRQWDALRDYAHKKGIGIIGDLPIYVALDSADVWAGPEYFQLDKDNRPTEVAGVPPDYFSEDGQLWGNPLYRWDKMKEEGYGWWIRRVGGAARLFDVVRIDHFRGFDEYFAIPADTGSAMDGRWEKGPGMELFRTLKANLGERGVIAEDLGLLTDTVRQLVADSGFPNMKVLQFAFDRADIGGANDYLPHNYNNNCVVYTGTHDNEAIHGWFMGLSKEDKALVRDYLGDHDTPNKWMYKQLIAMAMRSAAKDCIIPAQDWLGLDNTSRMNAPGTVGVNWSWRLLPGQMTDELAQEILTVTKRFGRANWDALNRLEKKAAAIEDAKA